MRDFGKARTLFEKTLSIYGKIHGQNHVETARVLLELGKNHFEENELKLAEQCFENSLKIFKKIKHPDIYLVLESFSELYLKKSLMEEKIKSSQSITFQQKVQSLTNQSISYLRQTLEIAKAHFPADSPHIIRLQSKMANLISRR